MRRSSKQGSAGVRVIEWKWRFAVSRGEVGTKRTGAVKLL